MKSKFARRLLAALWFAVAAAIPVSSFLLTWGMPGYGPMRVIIIGVPIIAAGIGGFWLGAGILNEEKVKSVFGAFVRGLAIALFSYLILCINLFIGFSFISGDIPKEFDLMTTIFIYGLFSIGWLIAAVGAAAGGTLYVFRLKVLKRFDDSREL